MALIDQNYLDMMPLGLKKQMQPHIESMDQFIESASEQVEAWCERKFELQTHTEQYYGNGGQRLILNQYPAHSVVSVTYEGDFGGPFTVDSAGLRLHSSGILEFKYPLTQGPWRKNNLYTISYIAGFDPIPAPIKHATALWVTELLRPNFVGPQQERPAEIIPLAREQIEILLDPYTRRRIG